MRARRSALALVGILALGALLAACQSEAPPRNAIATRPPVETMPREAPQVVIPTRPPAATRPPRGKPAPLTTRPARVVPVPGAVRTPTPTPEPTSDAAPLAPGPQSDG